MKYLILTFYYEPDLCAGSFRNTAFIKEFQKQINPDDSVDVITTMPNRYHSFNIEAKAFEETDNVKVFRIQLSKHKSGLVDQIFSFIDYYRSVFKITKNSKYDAVFGSSSRLFTAFAAARLAQKFNLPLYLDIRDIFSETISQVIKNKFLSKSISIFIQRIEKYTIKRTDHLNLVSPGFENYFRTFYSGSISFFTNGIDEEFFNFPIDKHVQNSQITITYAGNIGEGQGLEKIIPFVAKELGGKYFIRVVGDGGTKTLLEKALSDNFIKNVRIDKPVNRKELMKVYNSCDFLFLHLNNYPAFEKVLPSKIFEYAATNKPILAGINGFPRKFIEEQIPDAIVFDSCDYKDMAAKIKAYDFSKINRKEFIDKYDRTSQMINMSKSFIEISIK